MVRTVAAGAGGSRCRDRGGGGDARRDRWQTDFARDPADRAAGLLTGFALAFARAVGEYGSVIFIAGNLPNISEIAPLLIVIRLEEFKYADATAIAVVMLLASFVILFAINRLQRWSASSHRTRVRRHGEVAQPL